MTKKPLPRYEVKEFVEKKKDGSVKSITYGIVKPNGDVVNEYKTDDRQD